MRFDQRNRSHRMLMSICLVMTSLLASCSLLGGTKSYPDEADDAGFSYPGKMIIQGFDFGPSVSKVIVDIPDTEKEPVTPEMFAVVERKKDPATEHREERRIEAVYYSDSEGNQIDDVSTYTGNLFLSLELIESPDEGALLYFNNKEISCSWYTDLNLIVKKNGTKIAKVTEQERPQLQNVDTTGSFTGQEGHTFAYASYAPDNASEANKRPLVIWLHGGGEGGYDPSATVYGNKVVALFGEEFQSTMDGAYILVPECRTAWIEPSEDHPADSIYLHDLKELIDTYVASNYIDPERILVGGCSNGGYMTLDLLLNYPTYFSAAFPICEIFDPNLISDDQLAAIKDIPMWFVYATNDQTVQPDLYEEPLILRLQNMGAENLYVSVFSDVHDTSGRYIKDGEPYQYYGHFSWIYFFNNECADGTLTLWQFLSEH